MWFRIDDSFYDHRKVIDLQERRGWHSAIALWSMAGSWCAKHLTDGAISPAALRRLGFDTKAADMLCDVGLWNRAAVGYVFHDWASWNPTRAEVTDRRDKNRNKLRNWRCNQVTNQLSDPVTNPAIDPDPTRPDPNPPYPPSPGGDPDALPPDAERLWQAASPAMRRRSSRAQLKAQWAKHTRADREKALETIAAWALDAVSQKPGEDFGKGLHTWLKLRIFASMPEQQRPRKQPELSYDD